MEIKGKFPKETFVRILSENIVYRHMWIELNDILPLSLKQFDGKVITKRVLTPFETCVKVIKETHPEFGIKYPTYRYEYGTFRLSVYFEIFHNPRYGNSAEYKRQDCWDVDIARHSIFEAEPKRVVFNWEKFRQDHNVLLDNAEHLKKIDKYKLALCHVNTIEERWNKIAGENQNFWDDMVEFYDAEHCIKVD